MADDDADEPKDPNEPPESKSDSDEYEESEKTILEWAWAEWDTVQKKIDTVSNFPFQVKAWSVTLSAAIVALFAKGLDSAGLWMYAAVLLPFAFKAVESKHNNIRDALSFRATELEELIGRLLPLERRLPAKFPASARHRVGRLPGVALFIIRAKKKRDRQKVDFTTPSHESHPDWAFRNFTVIWHKKIVPHADRVFFICHFCILLTVITAINLRAPHDGAARPNGSAELKRPLQSREDEKRETQIAR